MLCKLGEASNGAEQVSDGFGEVIYNDGEMLCKLGEASDRAE